MLTISNRNIAATMVAPVMASVMDDFKTTNINISSLTVNIYFLGFALSPLVIPSLSEMYGRLPIYHTCNFLFVAFIIAGSLSKTAGQFIAFRLLAGCAGAAPLTIGGGTLADVNDTENCGFAFALFALGPVLGPVRIVEIPPKPSYLLPSAFCLRELCANCQDRS